MLVKAIETFKKLSGEVVKVWDVLDLPPEKASGLIERGRVRPLSPSPAPPPCSETGSKQAYPYHPPPKPALKRKIRGIPT